eukprot:gene12390-16618_t
MDFPTYRGINIEYTAEPASLERFESISCLVELTCQHGLLSRESIRLIIDNKGHCRFLAKQFITSGKHLLHIPFMFDLSYQSLKREITPPQWSGWKELTAANKLFEANFVWKYNVQINYFSRNLKLVLCIVGVMKKIRDADAAQDRSRLSFIAIEFDAYWKYLRKDISTPFNNWKDHEAELFKTCTFYNCLPDGKRFAQELFEKVVLPFTTKYTNIFGGVLDYNEFIFISSVIQSRSFHEDSDQSCLLPVIDLFNGKPNKQHNCSLERCILNFNNGKSVHYIHSVTATRNINAGEELFLEYAQCSNGAYLLSYNHLPVDRNVIYHNNSTEVHFDFSDFLETQLLRIHPNDPNIRRVKRQHVYNHFDVPKLIIVSIEEMTTEPSIIQTLRQVLIFVQASAKDTLESVQSLRLRVKQFEPTRIFHLFLEFIHMNMPKPDFALFRTAIVDSHLEEAELSKLVTIPASNSSSGVLPSSHQLELAPSKSLIPTKSPVEGSKNEANSLVSESSAEVSVASTQSNDFTPNMRSAVLLQVSERIVLEFMINQFIQLFPEPHRLIATELMRPDYLISGKISQLFDEYEAKLFAASHHCCVVCGTKGKVSKCSRCKSVYYCGADCQKENWTHHKRFCKK